MGPTPVLHLLVGPNGAGKSTLAAILCDITGLPFVNADEIAAAEFGADAMARSRDAAAIAEARRRDLIGRRVSFISETVASHPSKVDLVADAVRAGHAVTVHAVLIPRRIAVPRVASRVAAGGHDVPPGKVLDRYDRLWDHVAVMVTVAGTVRFYDNSRAADPFRLLAEYRDGQPVTGPSWPAWVPAALAALPDGTGR